MLYTVHKKTADWPGLPNKEIFSFRSPDVEHRGRGAPEVPWDPTPSRVLFGAHIQHWDTDRKTKMI